MSLILDALKRAEQERKLGQPPEAVQVATMSPVAGPSRARDRTLVVVLAILLLAAAIVIAALLLRSHSAASNASAEASLPATPAASPMSQPRAAPAPSQPAPSPAPTVIEDKSSVNNLDDVVASDDGAAENAQAERVAQGKLPSANADSNPHMAPPTSTRPSAGPRVAVTSSTPDTVVEQSSEPDNGDDNASAVTPPAPSLRDMPEGYRDAFPPLTIDVHVYDDDPEHRFIIVGGNAYHEGNSLPQGPRIVSITSDGVVFEWQGQKILYGLGDR